MDRSNGCASLTAGIEQEIAILYELEAPGMLRYAVKIAGNRATAQDALQEAFFRFFIARSAGQTIQSPKAWLFRVIRNYILDQKKSASRNEVALESALSLPSPVQHAESGYDRSDLLRRAMKLGLSARETECVRLRAEGLRYEDIGDVLGVRMGTVGALLARAHEKIRQAAKQAILISRDTGMALAQENHYAP